MSLVAPADGSCCGHCPGCTQEPNRSSRARRRLGKETYGIVVLKHPIGALGEGNTANILILTEKRSQILQYALNLSFSLADAHVSTEAAM